MPITVKLHVLMLAFVLFTILASVGSAIAAKRRARLRENACIQAGVMALLWIVYNAYYFAPSRFNWRVSLPLHVCDLLGPSAAVAIGFAYRPARAVLYFCALALAGQAVLTPTGDQNPVTLRFWLYWTLHSGILAFSALDLIVLKFRPTLKDYTSVVVIDVVYALMIVPIDIALGWNYGYLGNDVPDTLTAISLFGPWPQRVLTMLAVVIAIQGLFLVPWLFKRGVAHTAPSWPGRDA
jgi:hypothetical integral membrane protein (TIGR02206 family)